MPRPGFVEVTYHHFFATPESARELLGRMLRYNLTKGLLAYGGLLIPLLAIPNYWIRRRAIRRQQDHFTNNSNA